MLDNFGCVAKINLAVKFLRARRLCGGSPITATAKRAVTSMRSTKQRQSSQRYAQKALRFAANIARRKRLGATLAAARRPRTMSSQTQASAPHEQR